MRFVECMGYKVYNDTLGNIDEPSTSTPLTFNTISPNSYGMATKDKVFEEALKNTDYLLLDGVYFALPSIIRNGQTIKKNQGMDNLYHFMIKMNEKRGRIFFMGSIDETLKKIKERASKEYPTVTIGTYSPPFKDELDDEDNAKIIKKVNAFNPDVVFVGMTAPKQEKWIYKNHKKIHARYIVSIGANFDWYAGNRKEIASIWWKLNLGWLIRILQRPEILTRNSPYIYIFLKDMVRYLVSKKDLKLE